VNCRAVILSLWLKPFVRLVMRRMGILGVRLKRSTCDVDLPSGSGFPLIGTWEALTNSGCEQHRSNSTGTGLGLGRTFRTPTAI
jgi:hypothetical protein